MLKKINNLRFWTRLLLVVFFVLCGSNIQAQSEPRGYVYDKINVDIQVNQDTTLSVVESQTFNFTGEYHEAWRTIPHNKISAVTDIQVFDGETGKALTYVNGRQDKLSPQSWGKYTYENSNGGTNIIWYYNSADYGKNFSSHSWTIKYKIHGAISFGKQEDRLYWNIFTDYSVVVSNVSVVIALPEGGYTSDKIRAFAYRSAPGADGYINKEVRGNKAMFTASTFSPKEALTIDIGFPVGLIDKSRFWVGWLGLYYGYIGSFLIFLITFIIGYVYWYKTEGAKFGRGTIIPEYQPPENLRPAMAEVILKEKVTDKGLTATVVDLAVRGFIKIEEAPVRFKFLNKIGTILSSKKFIVLLVASFFVFLSALFFSDSDSNIYVVLVPFIIMAAMFLLVMFGKALGGVDYIISATKSWEDSSELEKYEVKYLRLLLVFDGQFSTKELRGKSNEFKKEFHEKLESLKEALYKETEGDTKAFEKKVSGEDSMKHVASAIGMILFGVFYASIKSEKNLFSSQLADLIGALLISAIGLFVFIRYEARLNERGRILREEWLGFKMYLEVAEKYRLQNLTPDLFEKYLPYAMIFDVEKKWSKAFEVMAVSAPAWYVGHSYHGSSSGASNFSPSNFSSSFSSSFTSAFATSGAGGGSAGGGGAGGGGGGGGGGAG